MLSNKLLMSVGGEETLYSDSVFSAYTYTGNGSTQTINNGIDLAGKGGLVWIKPRSQASSHALFDTNRGIRYQLNTDATGGQVDRNGVHGVTSFNSTGFTILDDGSIDLNQSPETYVSWTFRKAPKFFDVVTFTTDGSGNATFPHALGVAPGMLVTKNLQDANNWMVQHRSMTSANYYLSLNTTAAEANAGAAMYTASAGSVSFVGGNLYANKQYVAYLFAHDPSADGIVQCGSYNRASLPDVNNPVVLGFEPQFVLIKRTGGLSNWIMVDAMRAMNVSASADPILNPNSSAAEDTVTSWLSPTAAGFYFTQGFSDCFTANETYIYLAIRRPNKPPTLGTQVYSAIARTGTGAAATVTGVGFAPDLVWIKSRLATWTDEWGSFDRLRGTTMKLVLNTTTAETGPGGEVPSLSMDGCSLGILSSVNKVSENYINHFFKRAPGVFDQVCYTGTGSAGQVLDHSLGVPPELVMGKARGSVSDWYVHVPGVSNTFLGYLSLTSAFSNIAFNSSATATTFKTVFGTTATCVSYLFASKTGVSKVGSYTGNGTSQTIDCGFTTGARFVMIKRTDSTGDWYVWDTTRGIITGNDPHLSLNTTAAEVTTDDSIDPATQGFIVNQLAATNINVTSANYIYLAFA